MAFPFFFAYLIGNTFRRGLAHSPGRTYASTHSTPTSAWVKSQDHFDLYELAEELVDVEDWFQQWRFRHMKTVERIIGKKPGIGGSSGVEYLKTALERSFFPELWEVRTFL
jgi:tryptophan 2,3-dioxygenase